MTDVKEGASSRVSFTILQNDLTAFLKANILTLTLKLVNQDTGIVINAKDDVDILDVNGGVLNTNGTGYVDLVAADNVLVDTALSPGEFESHVAEIKFTGAGSTSSSGSVSFRVEKIW